MAVRDVTSFVNNDFMFNRLNSFSMMKIIISCSSTEPTLESWSGVSLLHSDLSKKIGSSCSTVVDPAAEATTVVTVETRQNLEPQPQGFFRFCDAPGSWSGKWLQHHTSVPWHLNAAQMSSSARFVFRQALCSRAPPTSPDMTNQLSARIWGRLKTEVALATDHEEEETPNVDIQSESGKSRRNLIPPTEEKFVTNVWYYSGFSGSFYFEKGVTTASHWNFKEWGIISYPELVLCCFVLRPLEVLREKNLIWKFSTSLSKWRSSTNTLEL